MYIAVINRKNSEEVHSTSFSDARNGVAFGWWRMAKDKSITSIEIINRETAEIKYTLVRGE